MVKQSTYTRTTKRRASTMHEGVRTGRITYKLPIRPARLDFSIIHKVHVVYSHFLRQIKDGCDWGRYCTHESTDDFKTACMLDNTGSEYVSDICDPKVVKKALDIMEIHGWHGRRLTAPYMDTYGKPCKEDYYGFQRIK